MQSHATVAPLVLPDGAKCRFKENSVLIVEPDHHV